MTVPLTLGDETEMQPPRPRTTGQSVRSALIESWKVVIPVVGLVVLAQTALNYFGPPRQTPAESIQQLTKLLNSRDSAQAEVNRTLKRGLLQNTYSICIIAKRPPADCAEILIDGGFK